MQNRIISCRIAVAFILSTVACAFLRPITTIAARSSSRINRSMLYDGRQSVKYHISNIGHYGRSNDQEESLSTLSSKLFTAIMEDQLDENALLNSRLQNLCLHRTFLGESTISGGGRGVFASTDCREGDLLTCYPGDGLVSTKGAKIEDWELQWGSHVDSMYQSNELRPDQRGYIVQATDTVGLLGLSHLDRESAYLGHFCNDGAASLPTCMEEVAPYVLESQDAANACHQGICNNSHMVVVATRAIRRGQEIFVCYGPEYWMAHNGFGS